MLSSWRRWSAWALAPAGFAALASLALPAALASAAFAASTSPSPGAAGPVVIRAQDESALLSRARVRATGLRIAQVVDRRGHAPEALGPAALEEVAPGSRLALSEPLAGFLQRSLNRLLSAGPAHPGEVGLALEVERFDLMAQESISGAGAECHARIAVFVERDTVRRALGWIQHDAVSPALGTRSAACEALFHESVAAIGRTLASDGLGARSDGLPGAAPEGALPTIHTQYRSPDLPDAVSQWQGTLGFRSFTGRLMKPCYRNAVGFEFGGVYWSRGRSGYQLVSEISTLKGTPQVVADTSWSLADRELRMWAVPIGVNYLVGLAGRGKSGVAYPYVGAGPWFIFGAEKLGARGTRSSVPAESFDGSAWALRFGFGLQALAGIELRFTSQLAGVIEGRYLHAGHGSEAEIPVKDDPDEDRKYRDQLHRLVGRSDFNFTGWGLTAGLRFYNTGK